MELFEYIKNNIDWIKDIGTLFLTTTATIIAVLTYRRARLTLLQPIRTEVIKKQSELLTKFLQFLKENNQSFEYGIDYVNLVQINIFLTLKDYGFILKNHDEIFEQLDSSISGWIFVGNKNIINDVEIIGTFNTSKKDINPIDESKKEKYEKLKEGIVEIEKIYQTKKFDEFMKELVDFSNDPFMPKLIQKTLKQLIISVNNNLSVILKEEIEEFMINFSKNQISEFNPIGVYNKFNHRREHHKEIVHKLRKDIREYLLIDESWK